MWAACITYTSTAIAHSSCAIYVEFRLWGEARIETILLKLSPQLSRLKGVKEVPQVLVLTLNLSRGPY